MAVAIDIRFGYFSPGTTVLGACALALSLFSATTLYLHGALWAAGVAALLAPLGLAWSNPTGDFCLWLGPKGGCVQVTPNGPQAATIDSVFSGMGSTVLRFRGDVPARTLLLFSRSVSGAQMRALGRSLNLLVRAGTRR